MAKIGQFAKEVKQETSKVTWPTKQETITTTIVVFIMVTIVAVFLFFADWLISMGVKYILGMGGL